MRLSAGHQNSEHLARRRYDHAGRAVVIKPAHLVKQPDQEKLRRQRRDRQIKAFDPQRRQTEKHPDCSRDKPRHHDHNNEVQIWKHGNELVRRIRAHRHKATGTQRHLSAIAGQNIQPERRHYVDQEMDKNRVGPIIVDDEWNHPERDDQNGADEEPVLQDRKDRFVSIIAGLKLAGFTIKHDASHPLDNFFAEQPLRPEQQERERQHIGEPVFNGATDKRACVNFCNFLADADDQSADDCTRHRREPT